MKIHKMNLAVALILSLTVSIPILAVLIVRWKMESDFTEGDAISWAERAGRSEARFDFANGRYRLWECVTYPVQVGRTRPSDLMPRKTGEDGPFEVWTLYIIETTPECRKREEAYAKDYNERMKELFREKTKQESPPD